MSEQVDIVQVHEPWSELLLEDGTRLRHRYTVGSVRRTNQFDAEMNPIYELRSTLLQTVVIAPQNLMRPSPLSPKQAEESLNAPGSKDAPRAAGPDERTDREPAGSVAGGAGDHPAEAAGP